MRAKWEGAQKERQDVSERTDVVSLKNNCRKQDIPEYRKRFLKWESPTLFFLLYLLSICISYSFLLFPLLSDLIILYSMVFTPSPNVSQIHDLHTQLYVLFLNDGWSSLKENWLSLFQQLSIVNSSGVVLHVYIPSSLWNLFWLGFARILHMRSHPLWVMHSASWCVWKILFLCHHLPPLEWTLSHYFLLHNDPRASGGESVT